MKKRTIKKIIVIILLVLLASLPSLVFAAIQTAEVSAPDLTLNSSDILFSPENPAMGQPVNITAIVHNVGRFTARNIPVDFYIDSTPIVQKEIDEIHPNSQKSSSINYIFLYTGSHNVTVTIERYVIISWDTNEISDSRVKCGMKSEQYTIEEHLPKYVLFHKVALKQIRLKNIYENTTYYFVVNSTDPSGNSAQTEEYMFVLTPPTRKAILPFILQIPITLYTHRWWLLPAIIIVLIITAIVTPRYKSRQLFNSLTGKPVGTEILMYLYTTFPNASRPADISKSTKVDLNGVFEALHTI